MKYLKLYEELKDDSILQDTKDILLEWSDMGNQVKIDWVDSRYKDEVVIIIKNETGNLDVDTFIRLFNYMKEREFKCDYITCNTIGWTDNEMNRIYIIQSAKDFNLHMDIDTINYYLGLELVFHKMKSSK